MKIFLDFVIKIKYHQWWKRIIHKVWHLISKENKIIKNIVIINHLITTDNVQSWNGAIHRLAKFNQPYQVEHQKVQLRTHLRVHLHSAEDNSQTQTASLWGMERQYFHPLTQQIKDANRNLMVFCFVWHFWPLQPEEWATSFCTMTILDMSIRCDTPF